MNFISVKKLVSIIESFLCRILVRLEEWSTISRIRGHSVWMRPISQSSNVVDLGANRGDFSSFFAKRKGCFVFAVEPNPELAAYIASLSLDDVSNLAITSHQGDFNFTLSENPEASSLFTNMATSWGETTTIKVRGIPFNIYLQEKSIAHISLLKVDVEGAEIDILKNLSGQTLEKIDQLTIEFHDFLEPTLLPEVESIITQLEKAGFLYLGFDYPRHENTLFIRKDILKRQKNWLDYGLLSLMKPLLRIRGKLHHHLQSF